MVKTTEVSKANSGLMNSLVIAKYTIDTLTMGAMKNGIARYGL